MPSNDTLLGALGAVIMGALGWLVLRRRRFPSSPVLNKPADTQAVDRLAETARSGAARASEQRREADRAAAEEILNRPHTDDPVADLSARLGLGSDGRPHGHGASQPPKGGDSQN